MQTRSLTRRAMMRIGAAGVTSVAAASLHRKAAVQGQDAPEMPPAVVTDGYAGGGTVPTSTGEAQFSLAVFARDRADGTGTTISGSLQLEDMSDPANPVTMTSDELLGVFDIAPERAAGHRLGKGQRIRAVPVPPQGRGHGRDR